MSRQYVVRIDVACVVEMDDLLQTCEIAVMHVGFHEAGIGNLRRIAYGRSLEFSLELWQKHSPIQVRRSTVVAIEEQSHSLVSKAKPERVAGKSPLVRRILRVPGKDYVFWEAEIVVGGVGEQRLNAGRLP